MGQVFVHILHQSSQRWAGKAQCFQLLPDLCAPIEQLLLRQLKAPDRKAIWVKAMGQLSELSKVAIKLLKLAPSVFVEIVESPLVALIEVRAEFAADLSESMPDTKLADFAEPCDKSFALLAAVVNEQRRKVRIKQVKAELPGGSLTITELMEEEQGHGERLKGGQNRALCVEEFVKLDGIEGKVVLDRIENLFGEGSALFDDVGDGAVRRRLWEVESDLSEGLDVRNGVMSCGEFEDGESEAFGGDFEAMAGLVGGSVGFELMDSGLKPVVFSGESVVFGGNRRETGNLMEKGMGTAIYGRTVDAAHASQLSGGVLIAVGRGKKDGSRAFDLLVEASLGKLG